MPHPDNRRDGARRRPEFERLASSTRMRESVATRIAGEVAEHDSPQYNAHYAENASIAIQACSIKPKVPVGEVAAEVLMVSFANNWVTTIAGFGTWVIIAGMNVATLMFVGLGIGDG
jgi:hypothetical protein